MFYYFQITVDYVIKLNHNLITCQDVKVAMCADKVRIYNAMDIS